MIIKKQLKDYKFEFNTENKELRVMRLHEVGADMDVESVVLDKPRMYSLFRFLVRISQKLSSEQRRK